MKIIHIVNSMDCGGQEKMIISLAHALNGKGYASPIVTIAYKGELAPQAEKLGIKVSSIGQKEGVSLMALWRLFMLIKAERPDILHLHNGRALIYGVIAAKLLGIPSIFTRHGSGPLIIPKWIWDGVTRVVTISVQAKNDQCRRNPSLRSEKVVVILNGVNIKDYEVSLKHAKDRTGVVTVGHVARLVDLKDQATLLKSFAKVIEVLGKNKARLVIAGDGPEKAMLEKLARDLGISAQVEFLGFREDIPAIVNTFDVFVLSSLTEGISLTLLEAMAASKPIVATDVGGNPEVVVNGKTGFLVPAKDPQAMADKILVLLKDPVLAKNMGAAGRRHVEEVFSLDRMTDEYIKVYRSLLEGINA